jgi:hypothetical protein
MPPRQQQPPRGIFGPPLVVLRFFASHASTPILFFGLLGVGYYVAGGDSDRLAAAKEQRARKKQAELDEQNRWRSLRIVSQEQQVAQEQLRAQEERRRLQEQETENKRWR